MAFHALTSIVLATIAFAVSLPANSESASPLVRESDRVRTLFFAGKYAELDALELETRSLDRVTSDGLPLREAYFLAFTPSFSEPTREAQFKEVKRVREGFEQWARQNPQSRAARFGPVIVAMLHAFAFRGEGPFEDIPLPDRRAYREKLAESRRLLEELAKDLQEDPEWYVLRLNVSRHSAEEGFDALSAEALNRHPRYLPLYIEIAERLRPRWGGSAARLKAFIDESVQRSKPWMGDAMYARLMWQAGGADLFGNGLAQWPRMRTSFDALVAAYPDDWNLNNYAVFACAARDAETLARLLERVRGHVVLEAWGSMARYATCAGRVSSGAP